MWFSLKRSSDQDKKKSSLNRTGFCLRAGRKPIGSFLSDLCYFVPYSRMSFKWTLQSRWLCLWCRSAFGRKKIKQRKMQIARDSGGLWYSAICDFYLTFAHFLSWVLMAKHNLQIWIFLTKSAYKYIKSKETIQTWMNKKLLALCRQFKQHSLFPNLWITFTWKFWP